MKCGGTGTSPTPQDSSRRNTTPREVVVNVQHRGAIEDLEADDIVEVPCEIDRNGARPRRTGRLPEAVRGLVESVNAYEGTVIGAALSGSGALAQLAMLGHPIIGQWELAREVLGTLIARDPAGLGYLK